MRLEGVGRFPLCGGREEGATLATLISFILPLFLLFNEGGKTLQCEIAIWPPSSSPRHLHLPLVRYT